MSFVDVKPSLAAVLVVAVAFALAGCGKRSTPPPPPAPAPEPEVVAPAATPPGVIGCGTFRVAIPNETKTQYVIVHVDTGKLGSVRPHVDLAHPMLYVVAELEIYERPVTGEMFCTDMGTEPQTGKRFHAVKGRVSWKMRGKLVDVVVEDARFVDADGKNIDVARRTAENVRVGWLPG